MEKISSVSKYLFVKERILEEIQQGDILADMKLPSEDKLAEMLNVSRTTVRSALQSLADEGIIIKKHGLGNFVQPQRHPMSTTLSFDKAAHIPLGEAVYGEFDAIQTVADAKAAQYLGISQGSRIVKFKKVMMTKGLKSSIITEHFPAELLTEIPKGEDIPNSIYEFAETYCGKIITKVVSEIIPISANRSPFGKENGPCLLFEERFLTSSGEIVAFSELYMNTNIIHPQIIRG